MDFGESIRRHSIVDEQLTRRLGWIMGGGGDHIYIYVYVHTDIIEEYQYNCYCARVLVPTDLVERACSSCYQTNFDSFGLSGGSCALGPRS